MKAGILILVIGDVIKLLGDKGFINITTGDFSDFKDIGKDLSLVSGIETILKNHGVLVPGRVDAIINILPLVASFIH